MTDRLDAYHFYESEWDSYEQLREAFAWEVPEEFNMAAYVCDRWAKQRGRVALFADTPEGEGTTWTYWRLRRAADRLANRLERAGVGAGDRVGVNLNQRPAALVAHLACWKVGAVSVPLSLLFGPDALEQRLGDCDAVACVVERANVDAVRAADLPALETTLTVGVDADERRPDESDLWRALENEEPSHGTADTAAEDPATIIYTSGTTGPPKGVLHAHRALLGHLPVAAEAYLESGDPRQHLFWTPVEWSWIGSLFSVVVPALYYGSPVVAYAGGEFDPHEAFGLIEEYGVTNIGAPPTVFRMMMGADASGYDLTSVRTVGSGGVERLKLSASGVDRMSQQNRDRVDGEVIDATIEVYVDTEREIVTRIDYLLTVERSGGTVQAGFGYRMLDVGSYNLRQPTWLDEARNRTG